MKYRHQINFEKLNLSTKEEIIFFDILKKRMNATYDWYTAFIHVFDENKQEYIIYDNLFKEITQTDGLTSADTIFILLYNNIKIKIKNYPGTKEQKFTFIRRIFKLAKFEKNSKLNKQYEN